MIPINSTRVTTPDFGVVSDGRSEQPIQTVHGLPWLSIPPASGAEAMEHARLLRSAIDNVAQPHTRGQAMRQVSSRYAPPDSGTWFHIAFFELMHDKVEGPLKRAEADVKPVESQRYRKLIYDLSHYTLRKSCFTVLLLLPLDILRKRIIN